MFDFLKKKKEPELDFGAVENAGESDEVKALDTSTDLGLDNNPNLIEPRQPEMFPPSGSSGVVTERDIQLILARMDLLTKKLEEIDKKMSEVLEIAKASK